MKLKTAEQVRAEFLERGESFAEWANTHKFNPNQVYLVLAGRNKGMRGKAHDSAVRLGLKKGVARGGA